MFLNAMRIKKPHRRDLHPGIHGHSNILPMEQEHSGERRRQDGKTDAVV